MVSKGKRDEKRDESYEKMHESYEKMHKSYEKTDESYDWRLTDFGLLCC
jgi:hypothetical protein